MCTQYNVVTLLTIVVQVMKVDECCINLINVVIVLNILLIIVVLLRPVILLQVKYMLYVSMLVP